MMLLSMPLSITLLLGHEDENPACTSGLDSRPRQSTLMSNTSSKNVGSYAGLSTSGTDYPVQTVPQAPLFHDD
jgi:hypothetical protein